MTRKKNDIIKLCEDLTPERIKLQFRIVFTKSLAGNTKDLKEILTLALANAENIEAIGQKLVSEIKARLGDLANA